MFIATLFAITKTLKQPKCPSIGEWTLKKTVLFIYTMEYLEIKGTINTGNNTDDSQKQYAEENKTVTKSTKCTSNHMKLYNRQLI